MITIHGSSPCCRSRIRRFGQRRRQCTVCGKTWRVRVRQRGRKARRTGAAPIIRTLILGESLSVQAQRTGRSFFQARHRFRVAIRSAREWSASELFPLGPYLLLVDGLWFRFKGQKWVLYLVALRSVTGSTAHFLDPVLLAGTEAAGRWQAVIAGIPSDLQRQIVALISDGFHGSRAIAAAHGWVYQRCHFHLLARLQAWRGWRKRVPGREIREVIFQLGRQALTEADERRLATLTRHLQQLIAYPVVPDKLAGIVRDFLRNLDAFHTYQAYPDLHLPTTTGSVEAMCKIIRRAVRTISSPQALERWAIALVRLRPTVVCNGKAFPDQPN